MLLIPRASSPDTTNATPRAGPYLHGNYPLAPGVALREWLPSPQCKSSDRHVDVSYCNVIVLIHDQIGRDAREPSRGSIAGYFYLWAQNANANSHFYDTDHTHEILMADEQLFAGLRRDVFLPMG
jgi:hypothetical protein